MPVGHAGAGGTAGGLVVVVDTETRLDHHIAVVVLVLAVFIYGGREQKKLLSPRGSQDQWEEKRKGVCVGGGHRASSGSYVSGSLE